MLHALPVYHALRARWPEAELGWAIQSEYAELVRGLPGLTRCFEFDRRGGIAAWIRLRRSLATWPCDLAVDVQGNLKSGATSFLARAALRVGLHPTDHRERIASRALHLHAPASTRPHAVDRSANLAAWLTGLELDAEDRSQLDLELSVRERAEGRERLRSLLPHEGTPVLVQIGRDDDARSARVEALVETAGALAAAGHSVLTLAGPAEQEEARRVRTACQEGRVRVAHLHDAIGIRRTAALMAAASERDGRFLGSDSGPLHLAAAVGLSTVAWTGPQDPHRTGAWPTEDREGSRHRTVWADPRPDCAPCNARTCAHSDGPVCIDGIEPRALVTAVGQPEARSE
ncbi:MAG: glycosyltransferase family 9 protein [Planctomycetota bacterium]